MANITGDSPTVEEEDYCPVRDELESIYAQLANECCSLSEDDLDYLDCRREQLEAELSQIQAG
ncbi:MAG: hypothetical protein AAF974_08635 [Cyanobacteria bacterium P01_E01_bin.34]